MIIGSISENKDKEKRISITPEISKKYIASGFEVIIENNIGDHLGIDDSDFIKEGCKIEKKEDIERLKNIQLDLHKNFINVVENSRSIKLKKDAGIELFSGEFWSGNKALELGLIDGLGNVNDILKNKFGENIIIKKFEKSKSWLARKLSSETQIEKLLNTIEEKNLWQKYGF